MEEEVVIAWAESIRKEVTISEACPWLGIDRETYYRWKAAWESKRPDPMVEKVVQLCTQHKFRYGYRKITALLRIEVPVNHKRIQ